MTVDLLAYVQEDANTLNNLHGSKGSYWQHVLHPRFQVPWCKCVV